MLVICHTGRPCFGPNSLLYIRGQHFLILFVILWQLVLFHSQHWQHTAVVVTHEIFFVDQDYDIQLLKEAKWLWGVMKETEGWSLLRGTCHLEFFNVDIFMLSMPVIYHTGMN